MAKKTFGNVSDDLFTQSTPEKNSAIPEKKQGRPRSKDLKKDEKTIKTSLYLTDDTLYKIDLFALKNKMDRSAAIRYLIHTFVEDEA